MKHTWLSLLLIALPVCANTKKETLADKQPNVYLNLFTYLYNETNPRRIKEYIRCLEKNRNHPMIKKIHVNYDISNDPEKTGVIHQYLQEHGIDISYAKGRLTLIQCMRMINELFPDDYVIFSNADIWFNETLLRLDTEHIEGKMLGLSRRGGLRFPYSQDTWIFKTPFLADHHFLEKTYIGLPNCEKPIIHVARNVMGLHVYNPCYSIHCMHEHKSRIRHHEAINHWGTIPLPYCRLNGTIPEKAPPKKRASKKENPLDKSPRELND